MDKCVYRLYKKQKSKSVDNNNKLLDLTIIKNNKFGILKYYIHQTTYYIFYINYTCSF